MPALPPVPSVASITFGFTIGIDLDAICRWHFKYSGGAPTNGDCVAFATAILSNFGTDLKAYMGSDRT
ncbi:MAG: hypothetical protein ACRDYC_13905, partial [Acidimicrobiales bacterium]